MTGVEPGDETLDVLPIDAGAAPPQRADPEPAAMSRARPILLALAAAVIGLVGFNLVLGDDPPARQAGRDDASAGDVDLSTFETPPDAELTDLVDGQIVRYELDALPFSVDTVTTVCLREPSGGSESIFDECDSGTAQRHTTSPGGVVEATFTVHRHIAVGGVRRIDCAEVACELRTYAAEAPGIVVSRATLDWANEPPEPQAAQITVEGDGRLTQGDPLVVVGTGFPATTTVTIRPCWLGVYPDPFTCESVLVEESIETGADGTFRHDMLADWQIGSGITAMLCADVRAGLCAMTVSIPGAARQPAAVPLTIDPDRSGRPPLPDALIVTPTEGLTDGAVVDVAVEGRDPWGDFGLFLCAEADAPLDCTWLDLGGAVTDGRYDVPRAFVSWRGTRHDCAVDGPCLITLFSFADSTERLEVPITFDPAAELREPAPVVVSPTTDLLDWTTVALEFESLISVPIVSICAVGDPQACESLPTESITGANIVTRARPNLVTPAGPHNCLVDGPCELIAWDAATRTRFVSTPLAFAPVEQRPLSGVARPSTGLRHGDTIQVAVTEAIDDVSISVCAVGGDCAPILVTNTIEGRAAIELTVVRSFTVRTVGGDQRRTDCAVDACEIRVSDGWTIDNIPLSFLDEPAPEGALAISAREPLALDEELTVRGRGFTRTTQRGELRLELCPPGVADEVACVLVGQLATDAEVADGTFETVITIPSAAFPSGFAPRTCERECELVARPSYGDPVMLPVIRDSDPP